MRQITFDIETKNFFADVGSNDPSALDISVVCIHDSLDNSYRSFLEKDFPTLWPIRKSRRTYHLEWKSFRHSPFK